MKKLGQLWLKRILCLALAVAMCVALTPNIDITSVFVSETGSEYVSFEITDTSADGAEMTMTRKAEAYDFTNDSGIVLAGAYLVLPASEDLGSMDYDTVKNHSSAVNITEDLEFGYGVDRDAAEDGEIVTNLTYTYALTGLKADTLRRMRMERIF